MLTQIVPKLPFINKNQTTGFYEKLEFRMISDYENYFIMENNSSEIHFFEHKTLIPSESDFMIYLRLNDIQRFYDEIQEKGIEIHPNGKLELKPWKQREFSLTDPNGTLLTFGESVL